MTVHQRHERYKRVIVLRDKKGFTFEQIGEQLNPPLTRSRAHQLYHAAKKFQKHKLV